MGAYSRKKSFQKKADSFTSRYMNGESKSFNDAPLTDSGAPIPTVSVPFGEENGGLISSIKKLLGKGDSDTEWISNPAHPDSNSESFENPLYNEEEAQSAALPPVTPVKTEEQKIADGHKHARKLSDAVISSKRKFGLITIKDGMFADVKADIAELNRLLDKPYPTDDPRKRTKQLYGIIAQYDKAIQTMQGYISHINGKGGGHSSSGKARLELVQQLLDQSVKDRMYFSACADEVAGNATITISTWDEILDNARVIDLSAQGTQLDIVRGSASVITKVTSSEGKTEFVKPEEHTLSLDNTTRDFIDMMSRLNSQMHDFISSMQDYLIQSPTVASKDRNSAMDIIVEFFEPLVVSGSFFSVRRRGDNETDESYSAEMTRSLKGSISQVGSRSPKLAELARFINSSDDNLAVIREMNDVLGSKGVEANVSSEDPQIARGSVVSTRNVSTSIMAERLGLSDTVARSRTVLVKNQSGDIIKANAMEKAEGIKGEDLSYEIKDLEEADAKQKAKEKNPGPPLKISLIYTPDVLVKMSDLLVFDIICGQTDRHYGNYMFTVTRNPADSQTGVAIWYVTDVKAFDNDLSFGDLKYSRIQESGSISWMRSLHGSSRRGERQPDGTFNVHYEDYSRISCMSKKTYDRIMSYSASMALIDQRHLRSKSEISALQDRLRGVKEELREMVANNEIMLVDDDEVQKRAAYEKAKKSMPNDFNAGYYFSRNNLL